MVRTWTKRGARLWGVATAVEHKDVVLGLLGASAALAGLVLVFLGLIVAAYGGLAGDTPKSVKAPLRRVGGMILLPFGLGIICMAAAVAWLLLLGGGSGLYVATVTLFLLQLTALAGTSVWALRELLWD
jgi:hypothetical protein